MDIRKSYLAFGIPDFTEAEIEAVNRVMRSGWVGMGPETIAFENELADYIGGGQVVTVNSCTSALFLSLLVSGVTEGDEVIVPSLTWCADANAVMYLKAKPVFCDVDPKTLCLTPQTVNACLTPKTKAVIVVHYGGMAVDVEALKKNIPAGVHLIEDAAHAFGAKYPNGKKVGDSENLTCFSFYANKNLSTAEGGAIAGRDAEALERLRSLRMNAMSSNAWSRFIQPSSAFFSGLTELGYKMNYTDLQAAIGRVQLKRYDDMANHRMDLVMLYRELMDKAKLNFHFQSGVFDHAHARHLLVGFFDSRVTGMTRDELLLKLRERKVGASIHYAPLHRMPLYDSTHVSLPATEAAYSAIMTLPLSAKMNAKDVGYVVDHLADILNSAR